MAQSIPSLAAALAQVPDPRSAHGRSHSWTGLLLVVAVGLLTGANTQHALARFAHHLSRPWLARLGLRQPPSQPTLHRLLAALGVEQVEDLLAAYLHQVRAAWHASARRWLDGIAIDGKRLRGAHRLGAGDAQLLSAYECASGAVLAQVAIPAGRGEIGMVGALLARLVLAERTVTFDAAFTQGAVAEAVIARGGAYLMVVKGNQPTLKADLAAAFTHRARCTGQAESVQAGHGRIEHRTLWVAPATAVREQVLGWPGARQLLELHRRVIHQRTGAVHEATVYAVTSLTPDQADAPALLTLWQHHWAIENSEHWVRDVVFGEDAATTRSGRAAQALAAFRNLALSLIHLWIGPGITAAREYYATHLRVLFRHLGLTEQRS